MNELQPHYYPLELPVAVVEQGKEHPFVQAVIHQLEILEYDAKKKTIGYGVNGGAEWQMRNHAARAVAFAEALRILKHSIGTDKEGDDE